MKTTSLLSFLSAVALATFAFGLLFTAHAHQFFAAFVVTLAALVTARDYLPHTRLRLLR